MKNALILHGTNASPDDNWFNWLRNELEKANFEVWLPELPTSEAPNMQVIIKFFLDSDFEFNEDTIIIGHSSGAVVALGLLSQLTNKIDAAYMVAAFKDDLGWDNLTDLFNVPLDFDKIQTNSQKRTFIHSDNDPYCPLDHAELLAKETNSDLEIIKGQGHFNLENSEDYTKFPKLINLIGDSTK